MPELPEVETTRRGIEPALSGQRIDRLLVRDSRLRWPVAEELPGHLAGQRVLGIDRRAKYLLFRLGNGSLICHLGMSGSMRLVPTDTPPEKHDHIDMLMENRLCLRYNDPRRFGCFLWAEDPASHPLLAALGPEPLQETFNGDYLYARSRGRRQPVKAFIMDQKTVVGVGNIYASEALFRAGISPLRQAGRISCARYKLLASAIREVLSAAIEQGGTTLRDFLGADGQPGYFRQRLSVYERAGQPCPGCTLPLRKRVIGQRASYFCPACQR